MKIIPDKTKLFAVTALGRTPTDRRFYVVEASDLTEARRMVEGASGFGVVSMSEIEKTGRSCILAAEYISV